MPQWITLRPRCRACPMPGLAGGIRHDCARISQTQRIAAQIDPRSGGVKVVRKTLTNGYFIVRVERWEGDQAIDR